MTYGMGIGWGMHGMAWGIEHGNWLGVGARAAGERLLAPGVGAEELATVAAASLRSRLFRTSSHPASLPFFLVTLAEAPKQASNPAYLPALPASQRSRIASILRSLPVHTQFTPAAAAFAITSLRSFSRFVLGNSTIASAVRTIN